MSEIPEEMTMKVVQGIDNLSDTVLECIMETEEERVLLATVHTLVQGIFAKMANDYNPKSEEVNRYVKEFADAFKAGADAVYESISKGGTVQ